MNIAATLAKEYSLEITKKIVKYIGKSEERFAELMDIFLNGEMRMCQRAAWAVGHCADNNPQLLYPYIGKMLKRLDNPLHDAVKRNTFRVWQVMDIPADKLGEVVDKSFYFLQKHDEAIAIRVFAMTVLANACKKEPDLKNELRVVIEDILQHNESPAFKNRALKILKALR